eukprot:6164444-Amphidinium_carterae.1
MPARTICPDNVNTMPVNQSNSVLHEGLPKRRRQQAMQLTQGGFHHCPHHIGDRLRPPGRLRFQSNRSFKENLKFRAVSKYSTDLKDESSNKQSVKCHTELICHTNNEQTNSSFDNSEEPKQSKMKLENEPNDKRMDTNIWDHQMVLSCPHLNAPYGERGLSPQNAQSYETNYKPCVS